MAITRFLKKRNGVLASRVTVRPFVPWYFRWLAIAVLAVLALGLSWGMYDAGRKFAGFDKNEVSQELEHLSELSARLQQDNEALRMEVAGLGRQSQMDLVTREDLARQVKVLGDENNHLKEDLAFFQSLMSGGGKGGEGVSVYRFKLERGHSPGEYRYSLLLVQGGQRLKNFQGDMEFAANLLQNGNKKIMPLPSENSSGKFVANFRFYQRVEGSFRVLPDATVESLQMQVFENGVAQAKLTQTVKLSL